MIACANNNSRQKHIDRCYSFKSSLTAGRFPALSVFVQAFVPGCTNNPMLSRSINSVHYGHEPPEVIRTSVKKPAPTTICITPVCERVTPTAVKFLVGRRTSALPPRENRHQPLLTKESRFLIPLLLSVLVPALLLPAPCFVAPACQQHVPVRCFFCGAAIGSPPVWPVVLTRSAGTG